METLVRDLMHTAVATVERNDPLMVADRLTKTARIRHMPVLDENGALVGIVSQRDIFHSALLKALGYGQHGQDRLLETFVVKEAMTSEVVTTTPDTPAHEAATTMLERKIGCLPVMEKDRLVGIVTETDFVARFAAEHREAR